MELNPKDATLSQKILYKTLLIAVIVFFVGGNMICYPFRKIKKIYRKIRGNRRLKKDGLAHLVDKK